MVCEEGLDGHVMVVWNGARCEREEIDGMRLEGFSHAND